MGRGVWKPRPATLGGLEWLPWGAAQDSGLGKEWVDADIAESHPSCSADGKREDRRKTGTKGQGRTLLFRWEGGGHFHLLTEPRGGRKKGTPVAKATMWTGSREKIGLGGKNQPEVGSGTQAEGKKLIYVFSPGVGNWGEHRAGRGLGESVMLLGPPWGAS